MVRAAQKNGWPSSGACYGLFEGSKGRLDYCLDRWEMRLPWTEVGELALMVYDQRLVMIEEHLVVADNYGPEVAKHT